MFRFLHIFIITNILISTYGIPVFEHQCTRLGNQFSFYFSHKSCCSGKKKSCHSLKVKFDKPLKESRQFTKVPCCKDKTSFAKTNALATQQTAIKYIKNFDAPNYFFATPVLVNNSLDVITSKIFFTCYDPPPVIKDILLMNRIFRC